MAANFAQSVLFATNFAVNARLLIIVKVRDGLCVIKDDPSFQPKKICPALAVAEMDTELFSGYVPPPETVPPEGGFAVTVTV